MADQSDGGSDQELETADDKQPHGGGFVFGEEEQDAANQKPDGNEEVIHDTDKFIAPADDQFFLAQFDRQRVICLVFYHGVSCYGGAGQ